MIVFLQALDGHPKVLDQYVDALVLQLQRVNEQVAVPASAGGMAEDNIIDVGLRKIVDALTLGCPFCHVALDPTPDAIVCCHEVWLLLQIFLFPVFQYSTEQC